MTALRGLSGKGSWGRAVGLSLSRVDAPPPSPLQCASRVAVENICWVKKQHNNKFAQQPGLLLNASKATMLVCRKGKAPGKMLPIGTCVWGQDLGQQC